MMDVFSVSQMSGTGDGFVRHGAVPWTGRPNLSDVIRRSRRGPRSPHDLGRNAACPKSASGSTVSAASDGASPVAHK